MSDEYSDPSGNTQQFRAFVEKRSVEPEPASKKPFLIAGVILVVFFAALIAALVFGRG
jgi:hypothetical protein